MGKGSLFGQMAKFMKEIISKGKGMEKENIPFRMEVITKPTGWMDINLGKASFETNSMRLKEDGNKVS